jgi:hypothetical protein
MAINPLQRPIDYAGMTPQVNIGQGIEDLGAAFAKRQERIDAEAQQAQFAIDLAEYNQNPTAQNTAVFITKHPAMAKALETSYTINSTQERDNRFNQVAEISAAFENGKPEIAKEKLKIIIDAENNSGGSTTIPQQIFDAIEGGNTQAAQASINILAATIDPEKYKKYTESILTAKQAPSALSKSVADAEDAVNKAKISFEEANTAPAKKAAELRLAEATAKEKEIKAQFGVQQELAALEKSKWDVKNLKSQINDIDEKLNLDKQTTTAIVNEKIAQTKAAERNLPADVRKSINESAVNAAASKQSANQFNDLAKRITDQGGNYGVASSASDYLKKLGGFQGGMTQLKQEYTRLRNTAAIKALPPGPATDRDIALALKGFPSETASATDLSNFLRGMAKLQDIDASIANAKTDWLASNNGVLTRAKDTFIAGDYATKPNESFNDFTQRVVVDVTQRYNAPAQKPTPAGQQIPNEYAPAPPLNTVNRAVNDVRSAADRILEGR